MKTLGLLFAGTILLLLSGCGDSVDVSKAKDQALNLANAASNGFARFLAGETSAFSGFQAQARALNASLSSNDFSQAREFAGQIDKLLQTRMVAQSIEFLKVNATESAAKAKAVVTDFMAKQNLDEKENKICRELIRYFESMDKEMVSAVVGAIVYLSLQSKMSHDAAIPTGLARALVLELFDAVRGSNSPPATVQ